VDLVGYTIPVPEAWEAPVTGETAIPEETGYHGFPELATGETGLDDATTGFAGTLDG